ARGLVYEPAAEKADVVVVNTCVVREGAEERALGRVANLAAAKKQGTCKIIAVSGCMAQKEGHQLLDALPFVDLVVGTRDLFKLGLLIEQVFTSGERLVAVEDIDKPVFASVQPVRRFSQVRGLVTVMYGCNNFCTFCIVPHTRGREVSRPVGEVVEEVQRLAEEGYAEVILLGQNVNSYYDKQKRADFADLLAAVNDVNGIRRIRFVTSHPKDCSPRLIEAMATLDKVCESIHLPVQAGSNRVLRRMKRFYTKEEYLNLLEALRARVPCVAITTDIIVGFPDETEQDFEETYDLMQRAQWDSAFMFMYSPRPGTKAAEWADSVAQEEKKRRLQRCIALQEKISTEINAQLLGTVQKVLVESVSKKSDQQLMGRTRTDKAVVFNGSPALIGQEVHVRITETFAHTLRGILLTSEMSPVASEFALCGEKLTQ
ncbi:MAG: tRNA (N6-isopentenyl adenosine(37)-C2)-methylthiotransferase MiaB, partial [Candidatus Sumerlaeaceae bacterium]